MLKLISFQDIINLLKKIRQNSILLKGRQSSTYDLIYEGKTYPPILVLSEANKLAVGEELTLASFGNSTNKLFKTLRDNGLRLFLKL